jgi:ribosomal protein L4
MPVKMKQRSLASALSHKLSQGQLKLVEGINKIEPKTKRGAGLLANLSLDPKQKVTLVLAHKDPQVERAFQNIPEVMIIYVAMLNTYAVLNGGVLVFTKEAAESLGVPTVARKSVAVEPKSATKKQPAGKKKPAAKK